jgi:hypothetical protein
MSLIMETTQVQQVHTMSMYMSDEFCMHGDEGVKAVPIMMKCVRRPSAHHFNNVWGYSQYQELGSAAYMEAVAH